MEIGKVDIDAVQVGARRRGIDRANVDRLKESIKALGLQEPIHVWSPDTETVQLVAGLHRLRAMEELGETEIPCVFVTLDERKRRMWELAENLHRGELTALQRDEHIAEWIALVESDQREVFSQLGKKPSGGRPEGGVNAAAQELGIAKNAAYRATKVAALSDEAKDAAREEGLDDNQSALLEAAAEDAENQAEKIRELARRKQQRKEIASAQDAINQHDDAAVAADILASYIPDDEHDRLVAALSTVKIKDLIRAYKAKVADRVAA